VNQSLKKTSNFRMCPGSSQELLRQMSSNPLLLVERHL
jgi:hypothetical protein